MSGSAVPRWTAELSLFLDQQTRESLRTDDMLEGQDAGRWCKSGRQVKSLDQTENEFGFRTAVCPRPFYSLMIGRLVAGLRPASKNGLLLGFHKGIFWEVDRATHDDPCLPQCLLCMMWQFKGRASSASKWRCSPHRQCSHLAPPPKANPLYRGARDISCGNQKNPIAVYFVQFCVGFNHAAFIILFFFFFFFIFLFCFPSFFSRTDLGPAQSHQQRKRCNGETATSCSA